MKIIVLVATLIALSACEMFTQRAHDTVDRTTDPSPFANAISEWARDNDHVVSGANCWAHPGYDNVAACKVTVDGKRAQWLDCDKTCTARSNKPSWID